MTQASPEPQVDPVQLRLLNQRLQAQQNLKGGIAASAGAALVGACIWAAITYFTGYQLGLIAVGIGYLVGYAMRLVGKGIDKIFGIMGGVFALLGCALGNLLAVCASLAAQSEVPLLEVLSNLDVPFVVELMVATFSFIDILFYGLALYEGYRLSFRILSAEERQRLLSGLPMP